MSQGDRYNNGKPKWSLVPQSSLIPMVQVLEFGAKKYGAYNWAKGLSIRETCESLKRHLDAFMEGEDIDSDSGLSHIGHIQCNALFLSWMMENRKDLDDRINLKISKMKYFRITFIPKGKKDKEWMVWQATSKEELKKFFKVGSIIDIKKITKEEYDEYLE